MVQREQDYLFAKSTDHILINGEVMPKRIQARQKDIRGEDPLFLQEALYERFYAIPYGHLFNFNPRWQNVGRYEDWISTFQPKFFSEGMNKQIIANRLKKICDGVNVLQPQCCKQIPYTPSNGCWVRDSALVSGSWAIPKITSTEIPDADIKSDAADFQGNNLQLKKQPILDLFDDMKTLRYPSMIATGLQEEQIHASGWLGVQIEGTQWYTEGDPTTHAYCALQRKIKKDRGGQLEEFNSAMLNAGTFRVETSKVLGRWMPQIPALVKQDVIGTPYMYADFQLFVDRSNFPNSSWCPSGSGWKTWDVLVPVQCQKGTYSSDGWILTSAPLIALAARTVLTAVGEDWYEPTDIPDNAYWGIEVDCVRLGCVYELTDHTKWWN